MSRERVLYWQYMPEGLRQMNLRVNRAVDCHTKNAGKHSRMSLSMEEGYTAVSETKMLRKILAVIRLRKIYRISTRECHRSLPALLALQGFVRTTRFRWNDRWFSTRRSTPLIAFYQNEVPRDPPRPLRRKASLRVDCRSHDISKYKHQHDSTKFWIFTGKNCPHLFQVSTNFKSTNIQELLMGATRWALP